MTAAIANSVPDEKKFLIILTVFLSIISILNLVSVKLIGYADYATTFGAYLYALTFPCTDVVSEVWGRERANLLVKLGMISYILVVIVVSCALVHPPAPFWVEQNQHFTDLFMPVPRLLLGSAVAYLVSQTHDVWAFHFWKEKTGERMLWLRNNLSTISSQLLDSIVLVLIAFAGTVPWSGLFSLIIGTYVVKLIVAVLDTPIVYLLVAWARR